MAALTLAERAQLEWVIDYLEKGGAGDGHLDQRSIEVLARVFGNTCGFTCGCPGSFIEGMHEEPFSTLLKVILCVDADEVTITGPAGDPPAFLFLSLCEFSVLAGTTITNTGGTVLSGDLGLSPGTSVVGFPPGTVLGTQHITDSAAAQAQVELTAAYLDLESRLGGTTVAGDIGGQTFVPGIYKSTSTLDINTDITLDAQGNPDAIFIFQIGSALTTAGGSVILAGGAQASNVFWQVGSSATIGAGDSFKGSILALTSITVVTGADVEGRLLARNGAVVLDTNPVITVCP